MEMHKSIRELAVEERPREKLLARGIESLVDAELLGIILSSGNRKESALELSRNLLREFGSITALSKASIQDFQKIPGIGLAKAMKLVASFELGRRKLAAANFKVRITDSGDIGKYMMHKIGHYQTEYFIALFLNRAHEIKAEKTISTGGMHATIIDMRILFHEALKYLASAIVVVHNHPSGNVNPSQSDISITAKIRDAGLLLDIPLLDHVIVSERGYFSFSNEGMLNSQ